MHADTRQDKPLVLVTLFGGGWHRETCLILQRFPPDEFRFAYAYGHCRGVHGAARLAMPHPGPCYPIHYLGPTRKHPLRFQRTMFSREVVKQMGVAAPTQSVRSPLNETSW